MHWSRRAAQARMHESLEILLLVICHHDCILFFITYLLIYVKGVHGAFMDWLFKDIWEFLFEKRFHCLQSQQVHV